MKHRSTVRRAFLDTIPVMTGYVFLGIGFGILLKQSGYGFWWSVATGVFIYAGSMQYLAVSLLSGGASLVTAAFTTLMVNARHLFYGISMLEAYQDAGKKKPYLIFALTDETYSLVSRTPVPEGVHRYGYYFSVSLLDHAYWVIGCGLGSILGAVLPVNFEGIDFALTALFVTVFVEQWLSTKNHWPAIIGVMSTAICLLLFGQDIVLSPSMIIIALLLTLSPKRRQEASHD